MSDEEREYIDDEVGWVTIHHEDVEAAKNDSGLRPCPFCGDEGKVFRFYASGGIGVDGYCVKCHNCNSETYIFQCKNDAIMAWNTRPLEDALRLALGAERQHAQACEQAMLTAKAEAERLRGELAEAFDLIARGVELMTLDELSHWEGVRAWQETAHISKQEAKKES